MKKETQSTKNSESEKRNVESGAAKTVKRKTKTQKAKNEKRQNSGPKKTKEDNRISH